MNKQEKMTPPENDTTSYYFFARFYPDGPAERLYKYQVRVPVHTGTVRYTVPENIKS